jgi:ferritin-like protein
MWGEAMFERMKRELAGNVSVSSPADQEIIISTLQSLYTDEWQLATQLRAHAERLRYPQYQQRVKILSDEKQEHVQRLAKKIAELGGTVPQTTPTVKDGRNDYQRLLGDLEDEKLLVSKYLHEAYKMDDYDHDTAELLLKIRKKEKDHQATLTDILMRTDRYGI